MAFIPAYLRGLIVKDLQTFFITIALLSNFPGFHKCALGSWHGCERLHFEKLTSIYIQVFIHLYTNDKFQTQTYVHGQSADDQNR
jgi:hypothetical protein